jgi:hypothetical protein
LVEKCTTTIQFEANVANNIITNLRYVNTTSPVNDLSGGYNTVEFIRQPLNQTEKSTYHNSVSSQNFLPNSEFEKWPDGTAVAPEAWTLTTSTCARDAVNQRKGSYCAALTWGGSAGSLKYALVNYQYLKGQLVTFGKWVKTSGASTARIDIFDGVTHWRSAYHSGGGGYEFLSVRAKIDASATSVSFILNQDANNVIYADQAIAVDGIEMPLPTPAPVLETDRLYYTFTWNPVSMLDGEGITRGETVVGASLGDFVQVAAPYNLQGIIATGYVISTDQVAVRVQNETGGTIDLASGDWSFLITKYNPA